MKRIPNPAPFVAVTGALLAALTLGCSAPSATASPPAAPPAAVSAPVSASPLVGWVNRYVEALGTTEPDDAFLGTLLIARGDEVVMEQTYGQATEQRYRIGSVTKPFTAVAILQLAAEGKLSLDDSIRKHIPSLPATHDDVTLTQILCHRSGLGNYTQNEALMEARAEPKSREEMLTIIAEEPLRFPPGSRWSYSNSGYFLLGLVVERASGQPWLDYLTKRVFEPAGMTSTNTTSEGLAPGLQSKDGALVPSHAVDTSIPFSAGALVSTADDLQRFALALRDDRLLPASYRERMWTDQGGPTKELGWGLGWMLRTRNGKATVGHNGGIDGFRSYFEWSRADDVIVVALSRVESVDPETAGVPALTMALTGKAIDPPKPPDVQPFDAAFCKTLEGEYTLPQATREKLSEMLGPATVKAIERVHLTCNDGYAFKPEGQDSVAMERRPDGVLVNAKNHLEIRVASPAHEHVPSFVLVQGKLTVEYERSNL